MVFPAYPPNFELYAHPSRKPRPVAVFSTKPPFTFPDGLTPAYLSRKTCPAFDDPLVLRQTLPSALFGIPLCFFIGKTRHAFASHLLFRKAAHRYPAAQCTPRTFIVCSLLAANITSSVSQSSAFSVKRFSRNKTHLRPVFSEKQ